MASTNRARSKVESPSGQDRPHHRTSRRNSDSASPENGYRPTVKDVARVAGVSQATVSKALNHSSEVSQETRQRVAAIASGLGYRPNAIARSLKARQSHTFGVITNDSDGLFTTAMVRGLSAVASEKGFGVFVCNSYDRTAKERQHLELLLDKQVDGIVLIGYKVAERGAPAVSTGLTPVVYLYEYTSEIDAPCILPDDEGGSGLATTHVIKLGRRRIGFINGPPSFEATHARLAGYKRALAAAGVGLDADLVRTAPDWNQDSGFRLARDLMRQPDPPDALLCANDELAAGAILGIRELGRSVPADVSVVGFDDRPFAAHLPIPLTTVALPLYGMGELAADRLFQALRGEPHQQELVRVPCTLVIRASCGGTPEHR